MKSKSGRKSTKDNLWRTKLYIYNQFQDFFKKYDSGLTMGAHNAIVDLQNNVVGVIEKTLAEVMAKKKFKVDVDFIDSDIKRIDLTKVDSPYWFEGEITTARPPGPTNQEVFNAQLELFRLFADAREASRKAGSYAACYDELSRLESVVVNNFLELYHIPNENIPFTQKIYHRTVYTHGIKAQNLPCEICGENRARDFCHIIPKAMGGGDLSHNILILCPTCHRLFDRFMLSKEEWERIDWRKKGRAAANFAYYAIRPLMEYFWSQLEKGIYEQIPVGRGETLPDDDPILVEEILSIIQESGCIDLKELAKKSSLSDEKCEFVVRHLIASRQVEGHFKELKIRQIV